MLQLHTLLPRCARALALLAAAGLGAAAAACSSVPPAMGSPDGGVTVDAPAASTDLIVVMEDPTGNHLKGLKEPWLGRFQKGDTIFDKIYLPSQGLGPVYIRHSCASCHTNDSKGPGTVTKMAVVGPDGYTPAADQATRLPWGNTVRPQVTAGATQGITVPADTSGLNVSTRVGPAVFARGYMEAIDENEIMRTAAGQAKRSDGIHGKVNHVVYTSVPDPDELFHHYMKGDAAIGRFGVKARVATLDDFAANAFVGDMGLTSPFQPDELPNPDNLTDDQFPGVDLQRETVTQAADYVRMLALPSRQPPPAGATELFDRALCSVCHVPSLKTRSDYPIPQLAGIDAPVYTDMLVHDMGDELADGQVEHDAGPRDFRTAPLIGLRHLATYLHDGRAKTVEDAIRAHQGTHSEAAVSVDAYDALTDAERATLLAFVKSL
jgi:CxxC motif-containing protein (DUF1111 family)